MSDSEIEIMDSEIGNRKLKIYYLDLPVPSFESGPSSCQTGPGCWQSEAASPDFPVEI